MGTKEIELTLDEVCELDDFTGVNMMVGSLGMKVVDARNLGGKCVITEHGGGYREDWSPARLLVLAARFVRIVEDHPHGIVETDPEKARPVKLGNGRIAVRVVGRPGGIVPWVVAQDGALYQYVPDAEVQALADEFGFEYLVPESAVEAAREEGRRAVIAEVADRLVSMRVAPGRMTIAPLEGGEEQGR